MLGAGVYFGSESSTAAQYTSSGRSDWRFMLMCNVALGKSYVTSPRPKIWLDNKRLIFFNQDLVRTDTTLVEPPQGYDSVHGVRSTKERPTEFEDDEFVIYDTKKQHMAYLVKFSITASQPSIPRALPSVSRSHTVSQSSLVVPSPDHYNATTSVPILAQKTEGNISFPFF